MTGEEYGLLAAEYWVKQSTWPLEKVAANINYDGIGTETYGPVKGVVGFGAEHSQLGATFERGGRNDRHPIRCPKRMRLCVLIIMRL